MEEKRHILRFIETSKAFDSNSKLKAILFVSGAKPSTYVHLRITDNVDDKHEFERLLRLNKINFSVSRAKGFEEISAIRGNAAVWKMRGIWYGYDLFRNKQAKKSFEKYVSLIKKQKHDAADRLAGKIYGYPTCCISKFILEHNPKVLPKKYTYYQYYKQMHDSDIAFPFISHAPCSPKCKKTAAMNKKYAATVKKYALQFYKQYAKKRKYSTQIIVDIDNDLGVWKKKDGHDYVLITKKPVEGKYYEISWLAKGKFLRGTVLDADVTIEYDYANVKIKRKIGHLNNFHHERKFTKL